MKLTGKTKEAFEAYSEYRYADVMRFPESIQNALIIEFFDSVGIYIGCQPHHEESAIGTFLSYIVVKDERPKRLGDYFKTRTEATSEAIIKANKIFNLK